MKTALSFLALIILTTAAGFASAADPPEPNLKAALEFFEKRVRPILFERCFECHSSQAKILQSGLALDSSQGLAKGGDGGLVFVPGQPEQSRIIRAIRYTDPDLQMPPNGKLTAAQIADLETWVRIGAPFPDGDAESTHAAGSPSKPSRELWSLRPLVEPPLADVRRTHWAASPIDRFILARLEGAGLEPTAPADRVTLLRRVTFDLTGLPPTIEEVDEFVRDLSRDAFERVIDRLLASPRYGERWGRHWLDVVRYADTSGCNSDYPIPEAHKYRDYVIQSFNDDLPYDQFIREQIAGDLLACSSESERRRRIIATGYLAISRRYGSSDPEFHLTIEDTIDNVGKAFFGLSVSCARCHDHKFDPITARDYYGLYGIFQSTRYAFPGMEDFKHRRDFVALADETARSTFFAYQAEVSDLDHELFNLKQEQKSLKRTATATDQSADRRPLAQVEAESNVAKNRQDDLLRNPPVVEYAYAVWEGQAADARVHIKGDPKKLGDVVPRSFLQVLGGQELPKKAAGSGRYELAQWLTDPKNPLTARVVVNRIWQHHFGNGLVSTANDFGIRGQPPTDPELLDWLAAHFIKNGWSFKAMHKLILLSSTYQQGSGHDPRNAGVDPSNNLHWRFDRRRLDAEEIRDAMLATSGALDLTMGGRHPFPPEDKLLYTQHKPFGAVYESDQRSVYLMRQRRQAHPYLDLFDAADPKATTAQRPVSTTPLQALFMMNSGFVHEQAQRLRQRIFQLADSDDTRIEQLYRLLFVRSPNELELREARQYLEQCQAVLQSSAELDAEQIQQAAWASYCRVLFDSNDFVFVD